MAERPSFIHYLKALYLVMVILLGGLSAWVAPAQAKDQDAGRCGPDTINMADQNWESAAFTTHVIRLILEHGYGCEVEIVPGATAAVESALVQDDLQIIAEQWSGRSPIIEEGLDAGKLQIIGDTLKGGAEQGWYVPDYVVEGDASRGLEPVAPDLKRW